MRACRTPLGESAATSDEGAPILTFNQAIKPIDVDNEALRRHLEAAETPALLMTIAHIIRDPSVLREDLRPAAALLDTQGGLSEEQQAEIREVALSVLMRYRDGGEEAASSGPPAELLRRIIGWAVADGAQELVSLLGETLVIGGEDPCAPRWTQTHLAPERDFEVAIIGAGFSGLLAAHRLRQAGVPFVVLEKNEQVGGTWFENVYPGCRVDVTNHLYNYSCAIKLDWPQYFCTQDVLLDYLKEFARDFGIAEHIRFRTEVFHAEWDEERSVWHLRVRTPDGEETLESNVVVSAVGQLNRPKFPSIEGRDDFVGPSFHSAEWDYSVDLRGRRVAVIGTGASALQFVPIVAKQAAELLVFQRTPPWLLAAPNYHDTVTESEQWLYENVPFYAQWYRLWLLIPALEGLLEGGIVDPDYPPSERAISARNDELRALLTETLEAQVVDAPELRPHVIPSYPVGAKRILRDNGGWIKTLKRDNVRLISDGIQAITHQGIMSLDGTTHAADVIIYGTGFQASRFLHPMNVVGRGGLTLRELWNGEARAYLGMTIPHFPNFFCLYGPNTNLVLHGGSIVYFSECEVTYLLDAIRTLLGIGRQALEVRQDVYDEYNARVDEANALRVWSWSKVSSWYKSDSGRSAQNWPFSGLEFWRRTRALDTADYELR